jgi:hypothetical protein
MLPISQFQLRLLIGNKETQAPTYDNGSINVIGDL